MATAQPSLFDTLPPAGAPQQRWWRLQGQARRQGRRVEPLLVTPRFLARIDTRRCPVTRTPVGPRSGAVVALRPDASIAAGHLVTMGSVAAGAPAGGWQDAWAAARRLQDAGPAAREAGLDAADWRRLAVLRSFVQALTPAEAALLPLHVLPPSRLRVLSPVQGLQVAMTLGLQGEDRAERLSRLAALADDADLRLALRVLALTLLARRPARLDDLDTTARRQALEDLWSDPLLQRRWQRLALRLDDATAQALLLRARAARCLGAGWRPLDLPLAIDGWDSPARAPRPRGDAGRGRESVHVDVPALAARVLAAPVLAAVPGGHRTDALAAATGVA